MNVAAHHSVTLFFVSRAEVEAFSYIIYSQVLPKSGGGIQPDPNEIFHLFIRSLAENGHHFDDGLKG